MKNKNNYFYTNVRQWGNNILYIGYDSNGNRKQRRIKYKPTLFVPVDDQASRFRSFSGDYLKPIEFSSIKDAKEFINDYKDCSNFNIHGIDKFNYEFIANLFKNDIDYDYEKIRKYFFDIEVYSGNGFPEPEIAQEPITAITIKDSKTKKLYVWTIKNRYGKNFDENNCQYLKQENINTPIKHFSHDTERDMLISFTSWFCDNPPDILSGWYSRDFDVPYIVNRIKNTIGEKYLKMLSPWGIVMTRQYGEQKTKNVYDIYGIAELDYMDLYKKYTYTASESYSLDFISNKHLNVGKLEYEGTLNDLLYDNYQKYVEYNIIDVERIEQLDSKLNFLELLVEVSYAGKVARYEDALGTVKFWEVLIYNHLLSKNQLPPLKPRMSGKNEQFQGAFVKHPITGMHNWVVSFDLASLYPNIIRQVNIGPETHIPYDELPDDAVKILETITVDDIISKKADLSFLKKYDLSMSGNKQLFRKNQQSFLSELMEKFFTKRKAYKKKMNEAIKSLESVEKELKNRKYNN